MMELICEGCMCTWLVARHDVLMLIQDTWVICLPIYMKVIGSVNTQSVMEHWVYITTCHQSVSTNYKTSQKHWNTILHANSHLFLDLEFEFMTATGDLFRKIIESEDWLDPGKLRTGSDLVEHFKVSLDYWCWSVWSCGTFLDIVVAQLLLDY